jgi:hypothetical protein
VKRRLNLVVTCSNRKRTPPLLKLHARALRGRKTADRAAAWIKQIESDSDGLMPAKELYIGNHWYAVKRITAYARHHDIKLKVWILSAGYGLVPFDAPILPYAASFSNGPDQVVPQSDSALWWKTLAKWKGPVPGTPRSLAQLAEQAPKIPLLVAASAPYVRAITADLAKAKTILSERRLAVISAGFKGHSSLNSVLLPCDERFLDKEHGRGGTAHTLNTKLAAWAVKHFDEWEKDFSYLHSRFDKKLSRLSARKRPSRIRLSDQQVISFITQNTARSPMTKQSVLLRRLRDKGMACEQSRFKMLYATVQRQNGR